MPPNLERVNAAAKQAAQTRFTALLHHIDEDALLRAFRRQKRQASAGVDGITVAKYEERLTDNIRDLCARVHAARYRPQPLRRVYIPKADGGKRPLGVPALEDKIVQSAVAEVLSAVYETDFLGFSYGFRPGRNPLMALDALHTAIMSQRVNWVLDADIRSFFDSVDHERLLRMVAHRIADPGILRLIELWLRAGVLESGEKQETDRGTPQGAGTSPLLANIFLHYILDLWVNQWRRRHARGRIVIVRYADDFVMGFESKADAQEMLLALKVRLATIGLTLHAGKTRLIEFGRFAALSRQRRGERRPETFAFLGFTHYCGRTRDGRFIVKHKTDWETPDAQADGVAPGRLAAHARATSHAARVVRRRAARALWLLWQAAQLSRAQRLLPRSASDLATLSETAQPEKSAHGLAGVRDPDGTLPPANSTHHSHMGAGADMTRVTLGKSRVRESRPPGSVRAKPNGRATRPRPTCAYSIPVIQL
ncbi:group II intron reverse transcriptase/maturase [Bradyrhizobium sp. WSM2793]|uniref:group II intron reverse transcriptase/maturase n=1 Tax=Bradyrhizobium sp. WSM2793 TaxID=1038866 RepID=UPI001FD9AD13|nr:group II intron reverse transcriptase/maturase [Bradyrhizobium sp. WSM2793]